MRKSLFFVVLLTLASPESTVAQVVPPAREVVAVDYVPPPATLEGLWDSADVVVIAQVIAVGPPFLRKSGSVQHVNQLRVVEILKGPERFPNVFRLRQYGGTVNVDGRQRFTAYPDDVQLAPGDEALFFLVNGEQDDLFHAAFGPAGLFEIRRLRDASQPTGKAEARIPAAAQRIQELIGLGRLRLEELVEKMRAFRGHRAGKK